MKRSFWLALLLSLFLCGCSDYGKLKINSYKMDGLERLSMMSGKMSSKMRVSLDVTNPTGSKFTINDIEAVVHQNDGEVFAEARSTDKSVISPHCQGFVPVELDVTLYRPMSMFLSKIDFSSMTVDLKVYGHNGIFPFVLKKENYPIGDFMKKMGGGK